MWRRDWHLATAAQAIGAQATGAQATGAQATGAQATGAQATGAQATGAQATGAPSSSIPLGLPSTMRTRPATVFMEIGGWRRAGDAPGSSRAIRARTAPGRIRNWSGAPQVRACTVNRGSHFG